MGKKESKDVTHKNLESFPDVAADILNVFIHGGRQVVKAENLCPAPTETEYAPPGSVLRNQLEDISKYEMDGEKIRVQYLLANQSGSDKGMILRKAGYVGAVYREQYDGKVADSFPVVSLVLYWPGAPECPNAVPKRSGMHFNAAHNIVRNSATFKPAMTIAGEHLSQKSCGSR